MAEQLTPPFVVWEKDDPELIFFENLIDIREDRLDCLWQEHYIGLDASGKRFTLRRITKKQGLLDKLFGSITEYMEIENIEPDPALGETGLKIVTWLEGQLSQWSEVAQAMPEVTSAWLRKASLPDLLKVGVQVDKLGAKVVRKEKKG